MGLEIIKPPRLKRDWKNCRIRVTQNVANHYWHVKAGTLGTITNQGPKGSDVTFDGCPCCCMQVKVSHLPAGVLEFIEEQSSEPPAHTYAERYNYLRKRDLETISIGGVFAGLVPENVVLNGKDLDFEIDCAIALEDGQ